MHWEFQLVITVCYAATHSLHTFPLHFIFTQKLLFGMGIWWVSPYGKVKLKIMLGNQNPKIDNWTFKNFFIRILNNSIQPSRINPSNLRMYPNTYPLQVTQKRKPKCTVLLCPPLSRHQVNRIGNSSIIIKGTKKIPFYVTF